GISVTEEISETNSSLRVDYINNKVSTDYSKSHLSRRFRFYKRGFDSTVKKSSSAVSKSWKLERFNENNVKNKVASIKMPIPWKFSIGKGK
uniref:Uncharacterized protein n=1 Tax=Ciona savignyi TaxID=51511 RepID=H2ZQ17_CIOSA